MSETFYTTAWVVLAAFFIAGAGAVLGGLVVARMRAERIEPADASDGYDETTELAVAEPAPTRVVAHRPMSAMSVPADLETQTIRIRIGREGDAAVRGDATPWWAGPTREVTRDFTWGRHDPQCQPESRTARPAPRFLGDFETTEYARLDWSGRTQEVDGLGGHPSGEHPVLDGAA